MDWTCFGWGFLFGLFIGTGLGLLTAGLCSSASKRHYDRVESTIAGRSYFQARRGEE